MQSIDSYHERGRPLLAWLYGIAKNLIRGQTKRIRRNRETIDRQTAELQIEPGSEGGIQPEMMDLLQGLDNLTHDQREALVLRFFGGLSAKETALVMGKTEHAVYSLQVRAIATLRRLMSRQSDAAVSSDRRAVAWWIQEKKRV